MTVLEAAGIRADDVGIEVADTAHSTTRWPQRSASTAPGNGRRRSRLVQFHPLADCGDTFRYTAFRVRAGFGPTVRRLLHQLVDDVREVTAPTTTPVAVAALNYPGPTPAESVCLRAASPRRPPAAQRRPSPATTSAAGRLTGTSTSISSPSSAERAAAK